MQKGNDQQWTNSNLEQERIAALAYELWRQRGCPDGSPDQDWFHAEEVLKNQSGGWTARLAA